MVYNLCLLLDSISKGRSMVLEPLLRIQKQNNEQRYRILGWRHKANKRINRFAIFAISIDFKISVWSQSSCTMLQRAKSTAINAC